MNPINFECEEALERLDAMRRGELTAEETTALRLHLEDCRKCLCIERYQDAFLERLKATGLLVGCPEELRQRVRRQCAEEKGDS